MAQRWSNPRRMFGAALLALAVVLLPSCGQDVPEPTAPGITPSQARGTPPGFSAALAARARHGAKLMATSGIVGTAIGLGADGRANVQVYTAEPGQRGIPSSLDGVPVSVIVTGKISAMPAGKGGIKGKGADRVSPTARFERPVPIGISTGNAGECSAGTIGARVRANGAVYALSNNHIYALSNTASIHSLVLQPGRFDVRCRTNTADALGTLSDFVPIVYGGAPNRVDAAIALTTTDDLGKATPTDGYGAPSATIAAAAVGQAIQKYGRTTGLTRGSVLSIEAEILVQYPGGLAMFEGQIMVIGNNGPFSKAGDSGALIVTADGTNQAVGLLFAGTNRGYTFANQIGEVLESLRVSLDGGS